MAIPWIYPKTKPAEAGFVLKLLLCQVACVEYVLPLSTG
jgi:hypothetical protein